MDGWYPRSIEGVAPRGGGFDEGKGRREFATTGLPDEIRSLLDATATPTNPTPSWAMRTSRLEPFERSHSSERRLQNSRDELIGRACELGAGAAQSSKKMLFSLVPFSEQRTCRPLAAIRQPAGSTPIFEHAHSHAL